MWRRKPLLAPCVRVMGAGALVAGSERCACDGLRGTAAHQLG